MEEKLLTAIKELPVWYGENLKNIRDLFSRKEENVTNLDDKFFSQYWQVYSWAAIIGFIHDKREKGCKLENRTSFDFKTILNASKTNIETVGHTLLLMAIGKCEGDSVEEILNPRGLLTIISEYAEGGAKYILSLRQDPATKNLFDHPDDFLVELYDRTKQD